MESRNEVCLTREELDDGYFFCCEWDYLVIHKDDEEAKACTCKRVFANDGIVNKRKPNNP